MLKTTGLKYRRIVIKFGTSLLTGGSNHLDYKIMSGLVAQIAQLHKLGVESILVSSGAIDAGRDKLGLTRKIKGVPLKQVLASVGQSRLMNVYENLFTEHSITVAQALLTKDDIRRASRELGLPTWDKPALACLASRIPYGHQITPEILARVEKAESLVRNRGFSQVRVRDYDTTARIEVLPEEVNRLLDPEVRDGLVGDLKELGYIFVTLDLEGYRTGSMNEVIDR